jgi:hypothetical protein
MLQIFARVAFVASPLETRRGDGSRGVTSRFVARTAVGVREWIRLRLEGLPLRLAIVVHRVWPK